jgi:hypothetical protein
MYEEIMEQRIKDMVWEAQRQMTPAYKLYALWELGHHKVNAPCKCI